MYFNNFFNIYVKTLNKTEEVFFLLLPDSPSLCPYKVLPLKLFMMGNVYVTKN